MREETLATTSDAGKSVEEATKPDAYTVPIWWALLRMLAVVGHLILGLFILVVFGFWWRNDLPWQRRIVHWWHRRCLQCLNVEVEVIGSDPLDSHSLVVCNHISWLDIPVLGSQVAVSFLAKSGVRRWPVVGWLAHTAGTHFIQRGSGKSAQVALQLAQHIQRGDNILVFPEGTSTNGDSVRRFHPNLFEAAIAAEAPVQPISITYLQENNAHQFAPFIDDDEFHTHLWRFIRIRKTRVQVAVLEPVSADGHCKNSLSRIVRDQIIDSRN